MKMKHERGPATPLIIVRFPTMFARQLSGPCALKGFLCQGLAVIALVSGKDARAADYAASYAKTAVKASLEEPSGPRSDWTGFYVGAHAGILGGHSAWAATQPGGAPNLLGSLDFFQPYDIYNGHGSHFGGFTGGYNHRLPPGIVAGVEADVSFPGFLEANQSVASPVSGAANYADTVLMFGTARGRLGFDANHWLYFATGGLAWTYDQFTRTQLGSGAPGFGTAVGTIETSFLGRVGWTVGAGIEAPVLPDWTAKIEYLYSQFGNTAVTFPLAAQKFESNLSTHQLRIGLNYQLGDAPRLDWTKPMPPPLEADNWAAHGQTTFLSQYAPPFHAPYRGANSLDSNAGRETWDVTLYIGRRLWQGAEFWIDPEVVQGFGLSNTLGVAGFTSGEAYKIGSSVPYFRVPRAFVRQTFNLGGDSEKVEAGINQFAGNQTADRLVLTVGKFSVSDIFDTISYAHDPRNDFMNWSLVDAGTFDYAADAWGYSYGAAAEWYHGNWTLRAGLFDLSKVPNSIEFDHHFGQFQTVYELEHRHEIADQPGKLALVGFLSRGRMGRYEDAIAFAQQNDTTASTADVRRYASRRGVNVNFEQQVVPNVGFFARAGFTGGDVEPYEFTDIDRTASVGFSLNGKLWGRPEDTFGIAGVVNDISSAHKAYLNAGGLGILVGDGLLPHPGREQILETYYGLPVGAWRLTADYQLIVNPAFNRDRGPASIIGARLRTQF
jgi:high affinity Mn2+ porin